MIKGSLRLARHREIDNTNGLRLSFSQDTAIAGPNKPRKDRIRLSSKNVPQPSMIKNINNAKIKVQKNQNMLIHGKKFTNPFYTKKMLVNFNRVAPRSFSEEKARGVQRRMKLDNSLNSLNVSAFKPAERRQFKPEERSFLDVKQCLGENLEDSITHEYDPFKETARFTFMKQPAKEDEKRLEGPITPPNHETFDRRERKANSDVMNMKYKDRLNRQRDHLMQRNGFNDVNIGKIKENIMIKQNLKNLYMSNGHQRHHSDITGLYSQGLNNLAKLPSEEEYDLKKHKKQLSSKDKIIREIFSPVKTKRRRKQMSYDEESNYGNESNGNDFHSFDGRNYTPSIGKNPSLQYAELNNSLPRNFTSDGTTGRTHLNTAETDTIHSLPGIQRLGGYKSNENQVIKIPKNKMKFVYITPTDYSRRKNEIVRDNNPHVFKIPSQRILDEHNLMHQ